MNVHYKCYISKVLTFLKELMLIKQVHQESGIFFSTSIFYIKVLRFKQMSAIDVIIY